MQLLDDLQLFLNVVFKRLYSAVSSTDVLSTIFEIVGSNPGKTFSFLFLSFCSQLVFKNFDVSPYVCLLYI